MNEPLEELACLYVLDELDASARADFEQRLARDAELAALVRELQMVLEARVRALPPTSPRPTLLDEIEARLRPATPAHVSLQRRHAFGWGLLGGLAAVVMVGVGLAAFQAMRHAPARGDERSAIVIVGLGSGRTTMTRLPLKSRVATADARFIQLASLAEQFWNKPDRLPVALATSARNGRGYAVFDPATNQGFLAVQHVPVLTENERYHLWLVDTTTGVVRDAGVLPLNADTRGLFSFSLPGAPDKDPSRTTFFITVENAGAESLTAPRGQVVLGRKPSF